MAILVGIFILLLVVMSWLAINSVNTISGQIRFMSEQNVGLLKAKNQTQYQLLLQVLEFEQGAQHTSKAVQSAGYGTRPISQSRIAFVAQGEAVKVALQQAQTILLTMDSGGESETLKRLVAEVQQHLGSYVEASLVTYDWWEKLKLFRAKKPHKAADLARQKIEGLMQQFSHSVDQISANQIALVEDQRARLERLLLGLLLVALIGGGLCAWAIIRGITTPLATVIDISNQLAEGELDVPISSRERRDEVGQLQRAMSLLVERLRGVIGGVTDSANQMASSAEELSSITGSSEMLISRQQTETDQIARAIREINETAHHVSGRTAEASQVVTTAAETTQEGNRQLVEAAKVVSELAAEIESSSGVMVALDEYTQEITSVLTVIVGIAEQTNLLALNAAIEAARAGEHGRGFAVVADEVRSLAQRTQESVQEIEQTITQLQEGTSKAVAVINSSHGHSQEVVDQSNQSVAALAAIQQSVTKIAEINNEVSTAAEEQSVVTTDVTGNLDTITQIAMESSTSVKQIAESSSELARVAADMRQAISYFKLSKG